MSLLQECVAMLFVVVVVVANELATRYLAN